MLVAYRVQARFVFALLGAGLAASLAAACGSDEAGAGFVDDAGADGANADGANVDGANADADGASTDGSVGGEGSLPDAAADAGPVTFTSLLSGGTDIACVRSDLGVLKCWGAKKPQAEVVAAGSTFTNVDSGGASTCAVRSDGALLCWVSRTYAPVVKDPGVFKSVAVGGDHQCAIASTGAMSCWGGNATGQLGTGNTTTTQTLTPVVGGATDWKTVRAGTGFTCALKTSGALYCWGLDNLNQLGGGNGGNADGGPIVRSSPVAVAAGTVWNDIDSGGYSSCGIRNDGALLCWGQGSSFATGVTPTAMDNARDWGRVRVDTTHACALKTNGALYCWGSNGYGQLGDGTRASRTALQQVGVDRDWVDVALGQYFTCAAKKDGSVWCWGKNGVDGSLGDGTSAHWTPTKIGAAADFKDVAVHPGGACAVKKSGANLVCWGGGIGPGLYEQTPQPIGVGTTWASVAVGLGHACARQIDDSVHCWGENGNGQAGVAGGSSIASPTAVGLSAQSITVGPQHSCALSGTTAYCWGYNADKQAAPASASNAIATPTKVSDDAWSSLGAAYRSTCGVRSNGELHCFGFGYATPMQKIDNTTTWTRALGGSLGEDPQYVLAGITLYSVLFTGAPQVVGPDFTAASFGGAHACGIHSNGTLWCSGANAFGQVGDGTTALRSTPVQIGTATDWTRISVAGFHTCGLRGAGDLYCWGSNEAGQIGDGTAWSTTPILVK
ncbi:MAG: hypothetical protein JWL95_979 [Gemmatimonadetes bacterium]|nr:hypothetical protein [Gemmatimonadota bacterium]